MGKHENEKLESRAVIISNNVEKRTKEKSKSQWFSKIAYLIGLIFLFFLGLVVYAYLIS